MANKKVAEYEFEDVEEVELNITSEEMPEYAGPDWEDYVMKQFSEDELYDGEYPTLNGLRRVAYNLMGPFIKSGPVMVQANLPESAYCIYQVETEDGSMFSAAADGHQNNIGGNYSVYPTTMAESRAEARVYRKMLMLSTAASEEIQGKENLFKSVIKTEGGFSETDPITQQQISIIKAKCKTTKINIDKLLGEFEFEDIKDLKKSDAVKVLKTITEYQEKGIPEKLK